MPDLPGNLSFASFIRQGLAAGISRIDKTGSGAATLVPIDVSFATDGPASPLTASANLSLVGPGEIAGLDSRVVVRVWPKADDNDAEQGSLPLIEFDQADLPWRYTPAKATPGNQLRPWINLVVLSDADGFTLSPATPAVKLPVLTVDAGKLPNLDDAWGWAHTQFADTSAQSVAAQIKGKPGLFTSRIICPRVLDFNTSYIACLVPTFARGRLAGTGQDPASTDALAPAWSTGSVQLPVYYFWRFATGSVGSFRQLARLIQPKPLPPDVGRRHMDVHAPGLAFPPISNATPPVLDVEGAIQSVEAYRGGLTPVWPTADQNAWVAKLKTFLNTPTVNVGGTDIKVVAPPLYGRWNAAQTQLNSPLPPGTNPPWFYQLNADPRSRVGGGLGTVVIQNNQQALLASGWKQVGDIRAVNQRLKVAQFGREVVTRVFERHVVTGTADGFWTLLGRLLAFGVCNSQPMCVRFDNSPVGKWIFDPFWRRFSRPFGPIGHYQGRPGLGGSTPNIIDRLNGHQRPAPEPPTPSGLFTPSLVSFKICFEGLTPADLTALEALGPDLLLLWALVLIYVARQLLVTQSGACFWHGLRLLRFGIALFHIGCSVGGTIPGDAERRLHWCEGIFGIVDVAGAPATPNSPAFPPAPPAPNFTPRLTITPPFSLPPFTGAVGTSDNADAAAFRAALLLMLQSIQPTPPLTVPDSIPDLTECRTEVIASLTPQLTIVRRLANLYALDPSLSIVWKPKDPLEPIFAPPTYEQPMYAPLAEISKDWVMPGINEMGRNTAGLGLTNQRFIEAYMVGLNQEMTRELMWNEFLTDQRATYFRQFWDIKGIVPPEGSPIDPKTLRDILPVSTWLKTSQLGGNSPRPAAPQPQPGISERLVLVVRAQLIQRYPNAIVYALKGQVVGSKVVLTTIEEHPVFNALIGPDVAFYGFNLTIDDARGVPGWFFVLAEQPGEPKFFFSDETPGLRPPPAGTAGGTATALFMNPFRIAIHGSVLLPPPT